MRHPIDHITRRLSIPKEMADTLRSVMKKRHFRRGMIVNDMASMQTKAYYITKGMARAYYILHGREHTYTFSFEDEVITIPRTLFKIKDAIPAIEFLEESDVFEISHEKIGAVMMDFSKEHLAEISSFLIDRLLGHAQIIEERLLVFQSMDATERYQWFTGMYPAILERATITQIASFLGVTKETLYRIRAGKYR